jgi:hypothetical protein
MEALATVTVAFKVFGKREEQGRSTGTDQILTFWSLSRVSVYSQRIPAVISYIYHQLASVEPRALALASSMCFASPVFFSGDATRDKSTPLAFGIA